MVDTVSTGAEPAYWRDDHVNSAGARPLHRGEAPRHVPRRGRWARRRTAVSSASSRRDTSAAGTPTDPWKQCDRRRETAARGLAVHGDPRRVDAQVRRVGASHASPA
ncbi:hypothetical protein SANTM175S_00180 [Streptomyces antimycoticus]